MSLRLSAQACKNQRSAKYRREHPERIKARKQVYDAIRRGHITRMPCQICGEINTYAHHLDYTKPFDIVWLCHKHHWQQHTSGANGMKICLKCKVDKQISQFRKNRRICKSCDRERCRNWYALKKQDSTWLDAHRKRIAERGLRMWRFYHNRDPIKRQPRNRTNSAIRAGRLFPEPCQVCGESKSQVHHLDYSRPLEVVWLCRKHHYECHKIK